MSREIPADQVRVHIVTLEQLAPHADRFRAALSSEEIGRLRASSEARASLFLSSRGFLRTVLAEQFAVSPREVPIREGADGKPTVPDSPIAFNVSHSGSWLVFALQRGGCVGVDVEVAKERRRITDLANRFFTPAECLHLQQFDAPGRSREFLRLWVRKEAALKATGLAIRTRLRDFDVLKDAVIHHDALEAPLMLRDHSLFDGTPLCVATSQLSVRLSIVGGIQSD